VRTESDIYVFIVVGKDRDINEHDRLSNVILRHKVKEHDRLSNVTLRHKVKEQLVVRKDIDVNVHDRLSHFTLTHKLNKGTSCSKKRYGCI
jgi:hypothetical protein